MKIYAYVKNQNCGYLNAVLPGEYVGEKQISKHGDYFPWTFGKRETTKIINSEVRNSNELYRWRCAVAVAYLKNWGEFRLTL